MRLNTLRDMPTDATLGDLLKARGDLILSLGAKEVLRRFRGNTFEIIWRGDDGEFCMQLRENEVEAFRLAKFVSKHGVLPPSARRERKTLRGLVAIDLGKAV